MQEEVAEPVQEEDAAAEVTEGNEEETFEPETNEKPPVAEEHENGEAPKEAYEDAPVEDMGEFSY